MIHRLPPSHHHLSYVTILIGSRIVTRCSFLSTCLIPLIQQCRYCMYKKIKIKIKIIYIYLLYQFKLTSKWLQSYNLCKLLFLITIELIMLLVNCCCWHNNNNQYQWENASTNYCCYGTAHNDITACLSTDFITHSIVVVNLKIKNKCLLLSTGTQCNLFPD